MDENGSDETPGARDGTPGWREPHLAQKTSAGSTWFPHWLQKGIRNLIRYANTECSGKMVSPKHLPGGPRESSYFTVKGTEAIWFSHSIWSVPPCSPRPERVILKVSIGDGGFFISIFTRPRSMFSL